MKYEEIPAWILSLDIEDVNFMKKFLLNSGSLKDLAKEYEITYPTIRLRMNRLIEKIKNADNTNSDDDYIKMVKQLAIDNHFDIETAKKLINEYRRMKK